ncbi:type IV pilin [Methanoregula sp.]|uniref:type IV pilin n=1 Tax=Methanoregula sp. TaxID=2052170 RepID=UPI00356B24E6
MAFTKNNDEAVSPVIGVILMVAITVILAAVIAAFVFGMAGNIQSAKTVAITMTQNSTGYGTATINGGADLPTLSYVTYSINGAKEVDMFPIGNTTVGRYNSTQTTVKGSRVVLIGYFTDGSTQMLVDKQF